MGAKTKQYGKEVLKMVKIRLPDIYTKYIKGRQTKLVEESGFKTVTGNGQKVGRLTEDLKLLFALVRLFYRLGQDSFDSKEKICGAAPACERISNQVLDCVSAACNVLFWEAVVRRFDPCKGKLIFYIQPDWSVTTEPAENVSSDLLEKAKGNVPASLLYIIERQMEIARLAMYAKKWGEDATKLIEALKKQSLV